MHQFCTHSPGPLQAYLNKYMSVVFAAVVCIHKPVKSQRLYQSLLIWVFTLFWYQNHYCLIIWYSLIQYSKTWVIGSELFIIIIITIFIIICGSSSINISIYFSCHQSSALILGNEAQKLVLSDNFPIFLLSIVSERSWRSPWWHLPHRPDNSHPGALWMLRWWGCHRAEPLQAAEQGRHHTGY